MREALTARRVTFFPQYRIGPFTVDFFLPRFNAVVETEGKYWHSLERARIGDMRRAAFFRGRLFSFFRCAEDDVHENCLALVDDMLTILQKGAEHGRIFKPRGLHKRS